MQAVLVGYGNAGRIFHAPLIQGVPGLVLAAVVSSRAEAVHADWPQLRVLAQLEHALALPEVALVVIASGNDSHYALARAALLAGKHVVVDKPCTVTLEQTQDLLQLAEARGLVLTVFQNRRWDADFLALRAVIESGVLGRIVHFESHFDRFRPQVPERWREQDLPGSGLWYDLGPHLLDQALQLFGPADELLLDLAVQRDGAVVNDYFHAQLRYGEKGPRVLLHASALVAQPGPRFVVHGTRGSFVKYGLDGQEDALKAGGRPQWGVAGDWGRDSLPGRITLPGVDEAQQSTVPDLAGNYLAYYVQLRDCLRARLRGQTAAPAVTAADVEAGMRLLTAGQRSAALGQWVCP